MDANDVPKIRNTDPPRVNPELDAACRAAIAWAKARQNDRYVWMALKRRPELSGQMVRLLSEEGLEWAGLADAIAKRHGLPGPNNAGTPRDGAEPASLTVRRSAPDRLLIIAAVHAIADGRDPQLSPRLRREVQAFLRRAARAPQGA